MGLMANPQLQQLYDTANKAQAPQKINPMLGALFSGLAGGISQYPGGPHFGLIPALASGLGAYQTNKLANQELQMQFAKAQFERLTGISAASDQAQEYERATGHPISGWGDPKMMTEMATQEGNHKANPWYSGLMHGTNGELDPYANYDPKILGDTMARQGAVADSAAYRGMMPGLVQNGQNNAAVNVPTGSNTPGQPVLQAGISAGNGTPTATYGDPSLSPYFESAVTPETMRQTVDMGMTNQQKQVDAAQKQAELTYKMNPTNPHSEYYHYPPDKSTTEADLLAPFVKNGQITPQQLLMRGRGGNTPELANERIQKAAASKQAMLVGQVNQINQQLMSMGMRKKVPGSGAKGESTFKDNISQVGNGFFGMGATSKEDIAKIQRAQALVKMRDAVQQQILGGASAGVQPTAGATSGVRSFGDWQKGKK